MCQCCKRWTCRCTVARRWRLWGRLGRARARCCTCLAAWMRPVAVRSSCWATDSGFRVHSSRGLCATSTWVLCTSSTICCPNSARLTTWPCRCGSVAWPDQRLLLLLLPCWRVLGCRTVCNTARANSLAANASGLRWPGRWSLSRPVCSPMNPPATWIAARLTGCLT